MTDAFVINYINDKLKNSSDKNYIRYTFYELRIKNNLTEEEIDRFLKINKDYFENKGYEVFYWGKIHIWKYEINSTRQWINDSSKKSEKIWK